MLGRLAIAALVLGISPGLAWAADVPAPEQHEVTTDSGWTFTLAPYVWLAALDGDVAQFGLPTVDVHASIGDILSHFDIGLMGAGEARYGRFSLATDFIYVKLSAGQDTPLGLFADSVHAKAETLMWTGVGGYSLLQGEAGHLDAVAGLRVWSVETKLGFDGGVLDGVSAKDSQTWVDPVIGLKGQFNFTPNLYLVGWALIGGFDVSSKFMWDAMGGLGYSFNDTISVVAGFRGLGVDFKDDGFVYDIVQYGPMLGGVIRF